jgi:lipopolysaccharide biosynthesis glycosyltransferase
MCKPDLSISGHSTTNFSFFKGADVMDFSTEIKAAVTKRQTFGRSAQAPGVLHVGFGFDAAYVRPMGVSLTSIVVNNPDISIHAHLFYSLLGEGDLLKLEALVKRYTNLTIGLYEVNDQIFNMLPVQQYLPLSIYFRLMMPLILPELDKILYLDSDVLCLGDIAGVLNICMDDKTVLVVSDVNSTANKRIEALGLKSGKYFNSGVMLIDVKKWNTQKISEKTLSLLLECPDKFSYFDQDALNIILENYSQYIDKQFNFILGKDEIPSGIKLLHCTAHPKPWKIQCTSKAQPLFLNYERLSPWSGTPLEYPTIYSEARRYSKLLFKNRRIKESIIWYKNYLIMKIKAQRCRHSL